MSDPIPAGLDVNFEKAEFDGVILAVLAYGALLMLYIQLLRVLLTRPKRGKVFWGITVYSGVLFILSTIAAGGKIKMAEYVYVSSRFTGSFDPQNPDTWIPSHMYRDHVGATMNVMSQVCTTLTPWISDAFMIYRLMVIWSYQWWLLLLPVPLYISHVGMSIPHLIAQTKGDEAHGEPQSLLFGFVFHTLCVSLNLFISLLIAMRLLMMRKKLELALGRLSASFYTSKFTILVESGGFATLWGIIYLATRAQNNWTQDAFLRPYYYVMALTRMIIVLRMAQNQAWCRDTVTAANTGIMDWEVSSTHTMPIDSSPSSTGTGAPKEVKSAISSGTSVHTLGS